MASVPGRSSPESSDAEAFSPGPACVEAFGPGPVSARGLGAERVRGLVRAHGDFVARSVRRLGVPESVADDVSQRVFLTAARKLDAIEPQQERAYLFGIALRMASDARRAWRRGRLQLVGDVAELDNVASSLSSPEDLLDHKQRREVLTQMLGTLPDKERTVFTLHEFDGLALSEIADRLALPAGTVASQLRRARLRFDAALKRLHARQSIASSSWLVWPLPLLGLLRRWWWTKRASLHAASATVPAGASFSGVASWIAASAIATSVTVGGAFAAFSPARASGHVAMPSAVKRPLATAAPVAVRSAPVVSASAAAPVRERRVNNATPKPRQAVVVAEHPEVAPSLQRELSLLHAARALLAADDAVGALDLLERYKQLPGPHTLEQEIQVLRVQALVARGAHGVARSEGNNYLEQHPTSPQAPAVQRMVEKP